MAHRQGWEEMGVPGSHCNRWVHAFLVLQGGLWTIRVSPGAGTGVMEECLRREDGRKRGRMAWGQPHFHLYFRAAIGAASQIAVPRATHVPVTRGALV